MARPKSRNIIKSINFEKEVLEGLESYCNKERMQVSTFVNAVIKKIVVSEFEFYRQMTKHHASEMHKYKTLMETAPDKPRGE